MSMITFARPSLASIKPSRESTALGALRGQAVFLRALLDEGERLTPASCGGPRRSTVRAAEGR